ncbi:MAG: hypothetical protein ACRYFX_31195 [Janthinobacterium lividum]
MSDFQQWQAQLTEHCPDAYLAIYLYDPRFGKSMLFATNDDKRIYYKHRSAEDVPLPLEYQTLPGANELCWTAHKELDIITPEDFAQFRSWYSKKPHWKTKDSNGEAIFIVQTGWVWVGQSPTPPVR